MSSLINFVREQSRQQLTGDDKFYKSIMYYFELRLPQSSCPQVAAPIFFFPLALNPENISMSEPFALEPSYTLDAGLFVEENGIVSRNLRIRGTTGFKPRSLPNQPQLSAQRSIPASYSRSLPAVVADLISGQRHFQYLNDAIFRTYGDFKRDPSTAQDTLLFFHNPKEDEHWLVAPRAFTLERTAQKPVQYAYDIDLLVLGPASDSLYALSEDKSILDELKDAQAMVSQAIGLAKGALLDLSNLAGQLKGLVNNFAKIIGNVTQLVQAGSDFLTGATQFIQAPFALVTATATLIETGMQYNANLQSVGLAITTLPDAVVQSIRQLQDAMHLMGTHPESFQTSSQAQLQALKQSQQLSTSYSPTALQAAAAQTPPTSFAAVTALGTGLLPGDLIRSQTQSTVGAQAIHYTGTQQHIVAQGDTLVSLAAQYLGDARLWQYIAVINGLKPPFTSTLATINLGNQTDEPSLPGTVSIGQTLLIPNFSTPPEAQPLLPVLGVTSDQSVAVHLLGRDVMLAPVPTSDPSATQTEAGTSLTVLDWQVDTEGGSVDFLQVEGIANMAQAILTRITAEKGTLALYQNVGVAPMIGLGLDPVDLQTAKFRLTDALQADPRIATVLALTLNYGATPDIIVADITAQLRGFSQSTNITTNLAA